MVMLGICCVVLVVLTTVIAMERCWGNGGQGNASAVFQSGADADATETHTAA